MTLLLTGDASHIGSHVLFCYLEAGREVIVLDNFTTSSPEALTRAEGLTGGPVTLWRGDVRDAALLERIFTKHLIEAVLHFAGLKAVGESVNNPLAHYDVNFGGSVTLERAIAAAGVFRLVFSTTAAVYGEQAQMPITETSAPGQPASQYGRQKLMVEQVLADLCAADPRWSVAFPRYFNSVGTHPSGRIGEYPCGVPANLVPYAMQLAVGRRPVAEVFGNYYPTPDGTGIREYVHIMDLALGHLAVLDYLADTTGHHIGNLGTGRGHSVLEVISGMERVINRPLTWTMAPCRLGDTSQCWADPTRAAADLGWRTTCGLDEMLADHWRCQAPNPEGYQS